jgi:hypothetical protein
MVTGFTIRTWRQENNAPVNITSYYGNRTTIPAGDNKMKNIKVHFSSIRLNWRTPKAVYQILDAEFGFDFDPCPPKPSFDGLNVEWGNVNYVNPPYGRQIGRWLQKGYKSFLNGKTVVFLVPSRTDTKWWHDYCMKASEIRFIKGRLKFDNQSNNAPFPSALVIFKPKD